MLYKSNLSVHRWLIVMFNVITLYILVFEYCYRFKVFYVELTKKIFAHLVDICILIQKRTPFAPEIFVTETSIDKYRHRKNGRQSSGERMDRILTSTEANGRAVEKLSDLNRKTVFVERSGTAF